MELIKINPTNEKYFSDDFIKGFECGAKRQFEADKKARPKGEWIKNIDGDYECSECHVAIRGEDKPIYPFCAWCGADMREREGE